MEVSEIGAFNSRVMWTNVQLLKPFPGFSLQPIPGWSNQTPQCGVHMVSQSRFQDQQPYQANKLGQHNLYLLFINQKLQLSFPSFARSNN